MTACTKTKSNLGNRRGRSSGRQIQLDHPDKEKCDNVSDSIDTSISELKTNTLISTIFSGRFVKPVLNEDPPRHRKRSYVADSNTSEGQGEDVILVLLFFILSNLCIPPLLLSVAFLQLSPPVKQIRGHHDYCKGFQRLPGTLP
ncbi:hypothetical protein Y032_0370g90 [Ancylostoma ceylanicum]|uniref:Uncharacterized protein n=1 Tax=Ancylostoma ceylanicum TaxID=53326 RepID=A0A016RV54_9BILA|nr:hypothetical protein Y032_0370g90 [Ancylostoma ceylanicum]